MLTQKLGISDWRNYSPAQFNALVKFLDPRQKIELENLLEAEGQDQVWQVCGERVASFERGPLLWLTEHTMTEDDHWMHKGTPPVAHFPKYPYFECLLKYVLEEPTLFIIKSREMMTSWLICAYVAWMTQWFPHIFWLLQTEKEDKVQELVNYCRILYRRQPEWMQRKNPIVVDNVSEIRRANGSRVLGVPKGENQVRLYHPHGYVIDEAAFLPEAEQCFNAVRPVARQIIAVSSDDMDWYHDQTKLMA
jgi:tellurite resistance-related uncharacterized protein